MDRLITIQDKVTTTNSFNEPVATSWSDVATVYAKVEEDIGHESYQSDQLTERQLVSFTIHYRTDIDVQMRIEYNERYYDIKSKVEIGRRHRLKLRGLLLDET